MSRSSLLVVIKAKLIRTSLFRTKILNLLLVIMHFLFRLLESYPLNLADFPKLSVYSLNVRSNPIKLQCFSVLP